MKGLYEVGLGLLSIMPTEASRAAGFWSLKFFPASKVIDSPHVEQSLWYLNFSNPICLAAGFDKNAERLPSLAALGFGGIEVGTITPKARKGAKAPRLFRLKEDSALINRMGLPGDGVAVVEKRLRRYAATLNRSGSMKKRLPRPILGVNIAPNPDSEDQQQCYEELIACFRVLQPIADYITLNISCPNVEKSRIFLSDAKWLAKTLEGLRKAEPGKRRIPVLAKISPDLMPAQYLAIADIARDEQLDGIVIGNTTTRRDLSLTAPNRNESGGLSGKPLALLSDTITAEIYKHTRGKVPLVGCGGIFSAQDAFRRILSGASLVQIYTSFAMLGPRVVDQIRFDLATLLRKYNFPSIKDAVGKAVQ